MTLAVFDLDGTVTRRDTFVPYLRGWLRRHPHARRRGREIAALWRYLALGRDRGRLKSELIRSCMAGRTRAEIASWTRDFVAGLGEPEFCPGALLAILRHHAAGDRVVLLSASVDLYVPAIAARLGFDEALCTGIAWQGDRLDGALATPNLRAAEKRRCIEALRARYPGERIAAYGNSRSDLPHLRIVDEPLLVNGSWRARRAARAAGIPVADWRNKPPGPAV